MLSSQALAQYEYPFSIITQAKEGSRDIVAVNNGPAAISVVVEVTAQQNVAFNPAALGKDFVYTVAPFARRTISVATAFNVAKPWGFKTRYTAALGDMTADHEEGVMYRLPFPDGLSAQLRAVNESVPGNPLHTANAVEFVLPVDTAVLASRDGVLADQKEIGRDLVNLYVFHSDGTFAEYGRLRASTLKVRPGQKVKAADQLGSVHLAPGSSEGILRLSIMRNLDGLRYQSLPFHFQSQARGVFQAQAVNDYVSPDMQIAASTSATAHLSTPAKVRTAPAEDLPEVEEERSPRSSIWIDVIFIVFLAVGTVFGMLMAKPKTRAWLLARWSAYRSTPRADPLLPYDATRSSVPFVRTGPLLEPRELQMELALREWLPRRSALSCKVSAEAVVLATGKGPRGLSFRSFDFVVYDLTTGLVLAAIDLAPLTDDPLSALKDPEKEAALRSADIPYLRFSHVPSQAELERALDVAMAAPARINGNASTPDANVFPLATSGSRAG